MTVAAAINKGAQLFNWDLRTFGRKEYAMVVLFLVWFGLEYFGVWFDLVWFDFVFNTFL